MIQIAPGSFIPHNPDDVQMCKGIELNRPYKFAVKIIHNWKFHRKLMALIRFAFYNAPESKHKKSFDVFRNDLLVLAGHYEQVFSLNGKGFKLVAKSLKYSKMTDHEKQQVYNDVCQVILDRVFDNYTLEQLLECADDKAAKFSGFL